METGSLENANLSNNIGDFSPLSDLLLRDWKKIEYKEAWQRQKELVELRIQDEIPDTLIFCEHPPVITPGRGLQREGSPVVAYPKNLEAVSIERGGLATYHGPGQIVVYPIVKMAAKTSAPYAAKGILGLIRSMENWVIAFLKAQGLDAVAIPEKTGVWLRTKQGEKKIASIGIAARHWVSYHGLALNFATGLEPWRGFNPCGFSAEVMTDLSLETAMPWTYEQVKHGLRDSLPAFWNPSK